MLYTDPIIHLLIDFIIEHTVAEQQTFSHRHKKIKSNQVQAALNQLENHGLLKFR